MSKSKRNIFTKMESINLIEMLKSYCELLKSHRDGNYKLIINSCNNQLLSYHHSVTIYQSDFSNPLCQFISHFIKEMPFSGLYCGILTCSYLRRILKLMQEEDPVTHKDIVFRLDRIKNIVMYFIETLKQKLEFEGHRLVFLVENSLKVLVLNASFTELLAKSIVTATILASDESSCRLGHISIKAVNGSDFCEVYNGVIYKLESLWVPKLDNLSGGRYNILLFIESLEISSDEFLTEFITNVKEANIKLVACQKLIDKKIIFLLRRIKVFALERLGEDTANALTQLSSAFPISDINQVKWNEIHSFVGVISSLKPVSILDEDYLIIENNRSPVVTLFVSHRNFDTLDQFKAKLKECIHAVYAIFRMPYILPEDSESYISNQMKNYEDSDVLFKRMMIMFAEAIEESSSNLAKSQSTSKLHFNNVYLLMRNSFSQSFIIISNILDIGMFVEKVKN